MSRPAAAAAASEPKKNKKTEMELAARELCRNGVVVIQLLTPDELSYHHSAIVDEFAEMPEYVNPRQARKLVGGAFGALGNSSSFHHPAVRELRQTMTDYTAAFFRAVNARLHPDDDSMIPWRIEQLLDRTSVRMKGTTITEETWHRDQSPTTDCVFGGWLNLDRDDNQVFSCVPRTQLILGEDADVSMGFNKLTEAEVAQSEAGKRSFVIPPGSWIVFFQNIVHEVKGGTVKYTSLRQYFGFRLTMSTQGLWEERSPDKHFPNYEAFNWRKHVFEEQGPPPIPSGQYPPMWPQMSLSHRTNLEEWMDDFKPLALLRNPPPKKTKNPNAPPIPVRFMPSLARLGLPLYPPYTEEEIAKHTPQPL